MCKPHKDERDASPERVSVKRKLQEPVPKPQYKPQNDEEE
jgi:hypothetical protein